MNKTNEDIIMLSTDKIEFLANEMNLIHDDIKVMVQSDSDSIISACADISTTEVMLDENNNPLFNEKRLAIAEDIIEELM